MPQCVITKLMVSSTELVELHKFCALGDFYMLSIFLKFIIGRGGVSPPSGLLSRCIPHIYMSSGNEAFLVPWVPMLHTNVKLAQLGHESSKVDLGTRFSY